jgi:UDP-glucose 4-epimerase
MKILVTGGAGFIGSHVVETYVAQGHQVTVLDDLSHGKREHVPAEVPLCVMDMGDRHEVERLVAHLRPHVLNHHAAQIDVRKSVADPMEDARINILGSVHLLQLCVQYGVKKVIFASTGGAIYGEQETFPAGEDHPTKPMSPYGIAKLTVEHYLRFYHQVHGLNSICLRYANVYGPRQDPLGEAGVVAIFSHRLLSGKRPIINGDGEQTRDYVFVGDVARANLLALKYDGSNTFNIGTGLETSVKKLFEVLNELTGADVKPIHGPAPPGEQRRSVIDALKAKKHLLWEPHVSLSEGLRTSVNFFRSQDEKNEKSS